MAANVSATVTVNGVQYRVCRGVDGDRVSIDRYDNGQWIWCGDGRWTQGARIDDCAAVLGEDVYDALDTALADAIDGAKDVGPGVEVRTWSGPQDYTDRVAANWDADVVDAAEYGSERADALYAALGVSRDDDDEYTLCRDSGGRLALIGLTVPGHRYAVEVDADDVKGRRGLVARKPDGPS